MFRLTSIDNTDEGIKMLKRKLTTATIVYLLFFVIFSVHISTGPTSQGEYFGIFNMYAILYIFIYGVSFSVFAYKVANRINRFSRLTNLTIHLLGGALFPNRFALYD
ncbi:hypothetical protein [Salinithrix halophila]|uniref:Uncharacterized protein n=1 Tax=Salinithrix halophila TaxID=1485204 RepID=A0ABV8JF47_9BACL